ncbi:hypothetical protein [Pseudomonas sichuanensis]|uniref:hypothetical protein n=1 Tax=Pseudomonas sichuanensis TaxID=2213015 RepID=UPI0035A6D6E9
MQDEVNAWCKGSKRTCRSVTDPALAPELREINLQCAMDREAVNNRCFADGNATHREQAIRAWERVALCESKIR